MFWHGTMTIWIEDEKAVTSGGILEAFYSKLENLRFSGEKRDEIPPLESYLRSLILTGGRPRRRP
jgi:hypothetical protein